MSDINIEWMDRFFSLNSVDQWKYLFEIIAADSGKAVGSNVKGWYTSLEEKVNHIESLIATSAWDVWRDFHAAPRASQAVIDFWAATSGPKAVLVLDSMSVREVSPILRDLPKNGLKLVKYWVAGSEIPSDTDRYAAALGLPGRASLKLQKAPASFKLMTGADTYVDSYQHLPFDECVGRIPTSKNLFIWHGWPDDALHEKKDAEDAFFRFIEHTDAVIRSAGFGTFLQAIAKGRELLITSDHGYANANDFQIAPQGDRNNELRSLGFARYIDTGKLPPSTGRTIPPVTLDLQSTSQSKTFRVAFGKFRPDHKGFPKLIHGGLSLMECCVPLVHVRGSE